MKKKNLLKKVAAPVLGLSLIIPAAAQAEETPTVVTPASDLRTTLDQLLSEHFVLAVDAMVKDYNDAPDEKQAYDALNQNALDMTPAIASVYGEEGAQKFQEIFAGHLEYSDAFVEAAQSGDEEARKAAEAEVTEFVNEFSAFLSTATEGNLPEDAAKEVLAAHEEDVIEAFDSYVEEDYKGYYENYNEGYDRMFTISKALSGAIVTQMPEKFENTKVDAPAAELRSTLNKLTAEHFALAAMSMQKGVKGAPDYDIATWAEDMNTEEYTAAIQSIYGEEGAAQFKKLWTSDHINAQAELVAATVAGDEAAAEEARESLTMFTEEFGTFLSTATEGNLPEEAAVEALMTHEDQVLKTFDSYVAEDYETSMNTFREGYAFTFGIGQALGDAIVKQMPDEFASAEMPSQMPNTGMGGAAEKPMPMAAWITFAAAVLLAGGYLIKSKFANQQ
ncbi:copper amine oxidase [Rossellomorea vietnamensis]|uniref:Copper amine oxidase n=1 Tax=Rossellomorea vietnamensis TaxID=218284 RepID=A0A5D4MFN6_9BACI|nr:copper amine oxidase [Rossellomorea vietnamensis]TYR99820.1 copper amine oxidase [Rossellomorea vietnamensis]